MTESMEISFRKEEFTLEINISDNEFGFGHFGCTYKLKIIMFDYLKFGLTLINLCITNN